MARYQSFNSASTALVFASLLGGWGTVPPPTNQSANSPVQLANAVNRPSKILGVGDAPSSNPAGSFPARFDSHSFRSLSMDNATIGWATGLKNVWYTTDGGMEWRDVTPRGMDSSVHWQVQLYSLDATHAWVAVTEPTHNWTLVYRTSNSGKSWLEYRMHGVGTINTFHFTDRSHGWLSFEQGGSMGKDAETIYQTRNGGATWSAISATNDAKRGALPDYGIKSGISFKNGVEGWQTGYAAAHGILYVYRTVDGGSTWKAQHLPLSSQLQDAQLASYPPVFFSQMDGILPIEVFGGPLVVYRTHDGGARWTPTTLVTAKAQGVQAQGWRYDFISMNIGFAISGRELFATKDGGQTWEHVKSRTTPRHVRELDFTSNEDGFALTNSGAVYHTSNGGVAWKRLI